VLADLATRLQRECIVCQGQGSVLQGMECTDFAAHFLCGECLKSTVELQLGSDDPKAVAEDGSVKCSGKGCGGVFDLCADKAHQVLTGKVLAEWKEATERSKNRQDRVRMERQIRQLQEEVELGPVRHQTNVITETVLTDACPRCGQAFVDFDGCFALACSNVECSCHFCGWCLEDCGSNAHDHVRSCPRKLGNDMYFGTVEEFRQLRRVRQIEGVRRRLLEIENREHRRLVLEAVAPSFDGFSRADVGLDE
jgi:hypothetical protein